MAAYDPDQHLDRSRPGQHHADPVEKALQRARTEREVPSQLGGERSRSPLGEEVERVAEHIRQLVGVVRYDPPTPGVVRTTRHKLIRELRLEPLALRRACSQDVPDSVRAQIDQYVRRSEDLARAVEDGGDLRRISDRIEAHLEELWQLAEIITKMATAEPHQLATQFARARDVHVYGL
jgi:hypothetical protein